MQARCRRRLHFGAGAEQNNQRHVSSFEWPDAQGETWPLKSLPTLLKLKAEFSGRDRRSDALIGETSFCEMLLQITLSPQPVPIERVGCRVDG